MMEPVAWTSAAQLQRIKEQPSHNHRMWGEPLPYHDDIPLVRLSDAEARIAELEAENAALAAHACVFLDGSGVTGDEHGNSVCMLYRRLEAAEALLKEAGKALEPFAAVEVNELYDDGDEVSWPFFYAHQLRAARAIHHKIGVKDE